MAPGAVASGSAHVGVQIFPFEDRRPWFSFAAELRGDAPASASTARTDTQISMLAGSALACTHWDLNGGAGVVGSLFACAMGTGGAIKSLAGGSDSGRSLRLPYVGVGARPGVEARFSSRAALRVQAEALGAVHSARFVADTAVPGMSPASFGGGLAGVFLF